MILDGVAGTVHTRSVDVCRIRVIYLREREFRISLWSTADSYSAEIGEKNIWVHGKYVMFYKTFIARKVLELLLSSKNSFLPL